MIEFFEDGSTLFNVKNGAWNLGKIFLNDDCEWCFTSSSEYTEIYALWMRQIADKLDELNGVSES